MTDRAEVRRCHTADLTTDELSAVRALLDASFGDFTDHDWDHGLGGTHALVEVDGLLVAHGALVQRRLLGGGRSLRAGYVEALAVHADHRRRGYAGSVMDALEALAPAYDVLALSASDVGAALYEARGWRPWRGPTWVLAPSGRERTPDDDGSTYVHGGPPWLDLDADLACDWREGDVW